MLKRFNGEKIKVKLYSPIENQKKYQGKLLGLKDNFIRLELDKDKILEVPFDEIQLARLDPDFFNVFDLLRDYWFS